MTIVRPDDKAKNVAKFEDTRSKPGCLSQRERERGEELIFWYETVLEKSVSLKTCISLLLLSLLNDYPERHQKTFLLESCAQ